MNTTRTLSMHRLAISVCAANAVHAIFVPCAGIVTEHGLVNKQDSSFDVAKLLRSITSGDGEDVASAGHDATAASPCFFPLNVRTVIDYVASKPALAGYCGDAANKDTWRATEIGDGNINFVYLVEGLDGGVIIKQGLPYVRAVGEGWPLAQARSMNMTHAP